MKKLSELKKMSAGSELTTKETVLLYLHDFVFWITGILLVFLLLFRIVVVSGPSMNETLVHGDYLLLVNNLFYAEPKQGDVVVISKNSFENGEPIIKRVIATGCQLVEINFDKGIVKVDGEERYEPFIAELTTDSQDYDGPVEVPEGCVFVMGDNRNHSTDSRTTEIGCVDTRYILGEAYFVMFPLKSFGPIQTEFEMPVEEPDVAE